jgi:hypothetical protein
VYLHQHWLGQQNQASTSTAFPRWPSEGEEKPHIVRAPWAIIGYAVTTIDPVELFLSCSSAEDARRRRGSSPSTTALCLAPQRNTNFEFEMGPQKPEMPQSRRGSAAPSPVNQSYSPPQLLEPGGVSARPVPRGNRAFIRFTQTSCGFIQLLQRRSLNRGKRSQIPSRVSRDFPSLAVWRACGCVGARSPQLPLPANEPDEG